MEYMYTTIVICTIVGILALMVIWIGSFISFLVQDGRNSKIGYIGDKLDEPLISKTENFEKIKEDKTVIYIDTGDDFMHINPFLMPHDEKVNFLIKFRPEDNDESLKKVSIKIGDEKKEFDEEEVLEIAKNNDFIVSLDKQDVNFLSKINSDKTAKIRFVDTQDNIFDYQIGTFEERSISKMIELLNVYDEKGYILENK